MSGRGQSGPDPEEMEEGREERGGRRERAVERGELLAKRGSQDTGIAKMSESL